MNNPSGNDLATTPMQNPLPASLPGGGIRENLGSGLLEKATAATPRHTLWQRTRILAAALVCGAGVLSAIYFLRPFGANGQPGVPAPAPAKQPQPQPLFVGWSTPDLVIVISGQSHGYWQPCGCSEPQVGGLTRRYNFLKSLKDKNWPVVSVDVGEIAASHGPQAMLKYEFAMRALQLMDYAAVALGKTEFNMPLADALGTYAINNPAPTVIATNLIDPNQGFQQQNLQQFKIVNVKPQLGFFSVVDSKIAKEITDKNSKFTPAVQGLIDTMKKNRASVNILIYQGTNANNEVGDFIARLNAMRVKDAGIPQVPIILCQSADPEPDGRATIIGNTTVVSVGWKGKYVGAIGLFQNPRNKGYELKYELVPMDERFVTPANHIAKHPVMNLFEVYTKKVKDGKYMLKYPRGPHPLQVELKRMSVDTTYVGSERCGKCHEDEFKVWKNTHHSHAFETLENKAKHPSWRQFDGECIVCHSVGFQYNSGYLTSGNAEAPENVKLRNVGCENCHGPGSAHVKNPKDEQIRALMNPLSTTKRIPAKFNNPAAVKLYVDGQFRKQDDFCQKCHDTENDVNWGKRPFEQAWQPIQHYMAKPANAAPPAGVPVINIGPGPEIRPGDKK